MVTCLLWLSFRRITGVAAGLKCLMKCSRNSRNNFLLDYPDWFAAPIVYGGVLINIKFSKIDPGKY
jgi:hypothetical protein